MLPNDLLMPARPTAERPLLGTTVLLVEDSRVTGEALRLMCLRSGARLRRADCLATARRHLAVYRPTVVIVDVGLPDGSGLDLLSDLARARPRVEVLLATSGETTLAEAARAAGADGFLPKPLVGLAAFQSAILAHVPEGRRPAGPRAVSRDEISHDPAALQADLAGIAALLDEEGPGGPRLAYLGQFLGGIARTTGDTELLALSDKLLRHPRADDPDPVLSELRDLLSVRLAEAA